MAIFVHYEFTLEDGEREIRKAREVTSDQADSLGTSWGRHAASVLHDEWMLTELPGMSRLSQRRHMQVIAHVSDGFGPM